MYHIFFIYLSVDEHLSCFYILAIVSGAVKNTGVHVPFQIMISSGCMLKNGFVVSYSNPIFSFLRNHHTVFHRAVPVYIPAKNVRGLIFSTPSPTLTVGRFLVMAILNGVR